MTLLAANKLFLQWRKHFNDGDVKAVDEASDFLWILQAETP